MSIRLTLIAHAETGSMRRGVFPADESLDERGRTAAAARATGPRPKPAALSSPAKAALETATALQLDATIEIALADLDVGSWVGRSVQEIGMTDADAATAFVEDPAFDGHGGESIAAIIARVGRWLTDRRKSDGIVLAVTHAAVIRAAAVAALDAPASAFWRIEVPPLASLALSSDGRRWTVRELRHAPFSGSTDDPV